MVTLEPTIEDFICASELCSKCLKFGSYCGISRWRNPSMSDFTSGSAFSLIVIPHVVCCVNNTQIPSPLSGISFATFDVMSIISSRSLEEILMICTHISYRSLEPLGFLFDRGTDESVAEHNSSFRVV